MVTDKWVGLILGLIPGEKREAESITKFEQVFDGVRSLFTVKSSGALALLRGGIEPFEEVIAEGHGGPLR
jgi:hypothetical protein